MSRFVARIARALSFALALVGASLPALAGKKDAPRITADAIYGLIAEHGVTSIDELIPLLPAELRANFSLVFDSRNRAQFASEEKPRAILFSGDGGFQLTFAGDDGVRGGNVIEMLTQDQRGKFRPSTITFVGGRAKFHPDPVSCAECHGKVIRPLWDGYPLWPGTYGSDHELLRRHARPTPASERFLHTSRELNGLRRFLPTVAGHPRYSHLTGLAGAEYADLANLNLYLSETLLRSTNRQIIGELLGRTGVERYLPLLLRGIDQTQAPGSGFTERLHPELERKLLRRLADSHSELGPAYDASVRAHQRSVSARQVRINPTIAEDFLRRDSYTLHGADDSTRTYALLEAVGRELGVDPAFWRPAPFSPSILQAGGARPADETFLKQLRSEIKKRRKRGGPIGDAPLRFKPIDNRNPLVDCGAVLRGLAAKRAR